MISSTLVSLLLASHLGLSQPANLESLSLFAPMVVAESENYTDATLSLAQILEKLRSIPVFVICDPKGNPIIAKQGTDKVMPLYFNIEEAEAILPGIQKTSGITAAKIFVASYADFYGKAGYKFELNGSEFEKEFALSLIKKVTPSETIFKGVPVFFLVEPNGNYLTIFENNSNQVPIFFSSISAENLRREAGKISNSLNKLTIKATSLQSVLEQFSSKPNQQMGSFKFMPHPDSLRNAAEILSRKN